MSIAVYEKSVNFASANLSGVKDNQESFTSREPPGIPHRGPLSWSKTPKDFQRFSEAGLSLRARGREFSQAIMRVSPSYFHRKQHEREPKELPNCTLPLLLIAYTRQFEILATTLQGFVESLQRVAKFLVPVLSKHNHSYGLCFLALFWVYSLFGLNWQPDDNYQKSGTILWVH